MPEPSEVPSVRGLRLLMTTDAVGGVFTYTLTLAGELARRGAEVHVATMGPAMNAAQRAAALSGAFSIHESTFALEWMPAPWDDVARAGAWLVELERRLAPDVVHLNGYCHAASGLRAPVVVVGHSCVLSWWEAVLREPPPADLARYRDEVRRGLAAAAVVLAPSAAMMSALERHYGPLPRTRVVPNGVRPPARPRASERREVVLAASRLWDRAKNVEALARIAPTLPWPVRVAGSDRLEDGTRQPLPNVASLGWLDADALGREMESAAVFAHPARYEPFGLCPVEAALRGCALVLGDIASLREVWGDAALFVDPEDDAAIARALRSLASDAALRASLSERAAARAARFTVERMTAETAGVYLELLGRSPRREARHETEAACAS